MGSLFNRFLDSLMQPAVIGSLILSILYATIWLVKLDDRVFHQNKQVEKNAIAIEEHNKEAEKWKRKILLNEQRNNGSFGGSSELFNNEVN